jgi:hypothetical protein
MRVDLVPYARALVMLVRFPGVILAPLLIAVARVLIFRLLSISDTGGAVAGLTTGLAGLFVQLLQAFALCVSLIIADQAWRNGRAPFDEALDEARRKAPDILMAALGFTFIIWVAGQIGGFLGGIGTIALGAVALFFFIYALPAAAIGGVPGGAALQISLDRARSAVPATIFVTVIFVLVYYVVPVLATDAILPLLMLTSFEVSSVIASLIGAFIEAVAAGYVALVLAKAYNDVSYGRRY